MIGSFAVLTFGCRVNQADSQTLESELRARGARPVSAEEADVVIVNTCSVTAAADQGARQTIRRVARLNPDVRVIVTGCYATRRPDEAAALPRVVGVVANADKDRLVPLAAAAGWMTTAERFGEGDGPCGLASPGTGGRTAMTIRVQTGCEERCSYCIIPETRGRSRSEPPARLMSRIRAAVDAGYKEIVLTGVHLGSYGRDLSERTSLAALVRRLSECDADVLFRISSLEPMDCTPEIVDLVATSSRLAPHFHLPLQHASNRVLLAMRRPYTIEQYAALVDGIRARIPNASIGSDIIVGFPGETGEDFEQLCAYLERSPLTHIHVFPYSDRPGTDAAAMRDKVPGAVVRERGRRIREIGQRLTTRFRQSQLGTTHRALTLEDGSVAVTGNYLKVRIPPGHARNDWVEVRILSERSGELLGG